MGGVTLVHQAAGPPGVQYVTGLDRYTITFKVWMSKCVVLRRYWHWLHIFIYIYVCVCVCVCVYVCVYFCMHWTDK